MGRRDEVVAALLEAKGLATEIVEGGGVPGGSAVVILAAVDTAIAYLRHPARFQAGHRVKVAAVDEMAPSGRSPRGTVRKVSPNGYVIVDFDPRHVGPKEAMFTPARAQEALEVVVGKDAFPRHDWATAILPLVEPRCFYCGIHQTDANEFAPCRRAPRAGTPHTLTVLRNVQRFEINDHIVEGVVHEAGQTAAARGYVLVEGRGPDIRRHPRGGTAFLFDVELLPDAPTVDGLPGGAR